MLLLRPFPCIAAAVLVSAAMPGTHADAAIRTVVNTNDSGPGSLRQAILDANAAVEPDTIRFAIPGAGPFTIAPVTRLPNLHGTLIIDGFSQAGSAPNALAPDQGGLDGVLEIEIRGPGNGFGLVLDSGDPPADVTLRGLAVNGYGPVVVGGNAESRLRLHGCYIGTSIDGSAAVPAVSTQCIATAGALEIGGTLPERRNLLANCGNGAIVLGNVEAILEGNLIGTDASGTRALPGATAGNGAGIVLSAAPSNPVVPSVRIGGPSAASRNIISGNAGGGIALFGTIGFDEYAPLVIQGNFIGTDWTGTAAVPNGFRESPQFSGGIVLWRVEDGNAPVIIGGFGSGEANLIAYNHGAGIFAREGRSGESFENRGNRIHHNRGVGRAETDIGAPIGPTPNDAGDADEGANRRQNWPEIFIAAVAGDQLTVTYRVDSTLAASTYPLRIDFYENVRGGSGALLGQDSYPASSAQQPRTVSLTLPSGVRPIPLVAVATSADGHSSEFSPAFDVIFEDDFD